MTNPAFSKTHFILVPSYNSGVLLEKTVREILAYWHPVWVIIDGSTDHSDTLLEPLLTEFPDALTVIRLPLNVGKGAAILQGIELAQKQGFTHVLTMDADQQHAPESIAHFMQQSLDHPEALLLGEPIFDASAPQLRVQGRKISNAFAHFETLGWGIHDSLFGMRVYPLSALIRVMHGTRWARRFDFEPEIAVRMAWLGIPVMNIATPVRYIAKSDGGISQFRYFRDNALLTWMHIRLLLGFFLHLPQLIARRR